MDVQAQCPTERQNSELMILEQESNGRTFWDQETILWETF